MALLAEWLEEAYNRGFERKPNETLKEFIERALEHIYDKKR